MWVRFRVSVKDRDTAYGMVLLLGLGCSFIHYNGGVWTEIFLM